MKLFPLLLASLICFTAAGQRSYTIDVNTAAEFRLVEQRAKPLPAGAGADSSLAGSAFLTRLVIDTLNKSELRQHDEDLRVEILDDNGNVSEIRHVRPVNEGTDFISSNNPLPLNCSCRFNKDTLTISLNTPPDGSSRLELVVTGKNSFARYTDQDWGTKYLAQPGATPADSIAVPAIIRTLRLNRRPGAGQELYARLSIITKPFYEVAGEYYFPKGYLQKRVRMDLLLRCGGVSRGGAKVN